MCFRRIVGILSYLKVPWLFECALYAYSNGRWLCITLNCEIIPMCFRIVILSQYVLELWNYPNAFWNCKIIPMRFGIVILSQCVLKLWYYPNYRISWSLGAAETGEAAVWARNLMSTIKQLPVMYHLSTLSNKKKKNYPASRFIVCPSQRSFLGVWMLDKFISGLIGSCPK